MTRIILTNADGAIDRAAVMRLAHAKYRSGAQAQSFGDALAWSWAHARKHRDTRAEGGEPALRRLETMLAHHIDFQRAAVHYARGDRLWVKEAWRVTASLDGFSGKEIGQQALDAGYACAWAPIRFEADKSWRDWGLDPSSAPGRYRHARFMPRWASRLTLIVEAVKVERLQDISEADAIDEGVLTIDLQAHGPSTERGRPPLGASPRTRFAHLWRSLHGEDAWNKNPYVAAITFRTIRANIDTLDAAGAPRREEPAHV